MDHTANGSGKHKVDPLSYHELMATAISLNDRCNFYAEMAKGRSRRLAAYAFIRDAAFALALAAILYLTLAR